MKNLIIRALVAEKKLFLLLAALVITTTAMAQHEIGVVVGGMNGLSYKYWVSDRFAVQADLAVGLTAAPTGMAFDGYSEYIGANSQYDFTINPNALYHFPLAPAFQLYAGGGFNLGLVSDLHNVDPNAIFGKFGLNAAVGAAYEVKNFVLAFDFRPGYALEFYDSMALTLHAFDWRLGLAVRYAL